MTTTTDSTETTTCLCPKCKKVPLHIGRYRQRPTELDICHRCRGIWFDYDEFADIFPVGAKELRADNELRRTRWRCPKCRSSLRRIEYPQTDTEILICADCCGLWVTPEQIREIRDQRHRLFRAGKLKTLAPVVGIKGRLIAYIDAEIQRLNAERERMLS